MSHCFMPLFNWIIIPFIIVNMGGLFVFQLFGGLLLNNPNYYPIVLDKKKPQQPKPKTAKEEDLEGNLSFSLFFRCEIDHVLRFIVC